MSQRVKRLLSSLRFRIYLSVTLAVIAVFGINSAVALAHVATQEHQNLSVEIEDSARSFQLSFKQETEDLLALGTWLATQTQMSDLVRARDEAGLIEFLEPWTHTSLADAIVVADAEGTVLARMRLNQPATSGDNVFDQPGFKEALGGLTTSGMEQDAYGRLQGRYLIPIYENKLKPPTAVMILGFFVDGDFLRFVPRTARADLLVVYKDRIAVSTLPNGAGRTLIGRLPPAEVLLGERESRPTDLLEIDTGNGNYLFKFYPIESPSRMTIGMYGIGVPTASIMLAQQSALVSLAIPFLLALVLAIVVAALMCHVLVSPLEQMQRESRALSEGDFAHAISIGESRSEMGQLAAQLETLRVNLRQKLAAAESEKRQADSILHGLPAPIVLSDHLLRFTAANPAAESMLRQSGSALRGRAWNETFAGIDQSDPFARSTRSGADGHAALASTRVRLRAQPQIILDIVSAPVTLDGEPLGFVHLLQDATEREQFLRDKDAFMLNVAHELRAPLASLRTSIDLLSEDFAVLSKQELRLMLYMLQRSVVKFQLLVENLIDIGSILAGRFHVGPIPSDVYQLIDDAHLQVRPLLASREQSVEVSRDQSGTMRAMADRNRIVQVLINLLNNASKYGPEGQPIAVTVEPRDAFLVISVRDRGRGIPAHEQAHLFERFYRAKQTAEEGAGVGLGLGLAREIIEAHGGQIGVRSAPGEGTTFWFSLPRAD